MSRKSGYLPDENWRWREIALSAYLPDDFNLALYHIKKQERQRRWRIIFFATIALTLIVLLMPYEQVCQLGVGIVVILPLLLSNYLAPTELSVKQDLIRLRAELKHDDILYPIAKQRLWLLRLKTLGVVVFETVTLFIFCIILSAINKLTRGNTFVEDDAEAVFMLALGFLFVYLPIRLLGAGIHGSFSPLPQVYKSSREPVSAEVEAAQIKQQIVELQQRLKQIEETALDEKEKR